MSILIPQYVDYVNQHLSDVGDHSKACSTFLTKVVPFLVETVLQDGIYFIRDFPNHQCTHLLYVSFELFNSYILINLIRLFF
jgi:hypothetical protein